MGVVEVDGERKLLFPDVEPWWPHTHGEPRLHDVVIDGEVIGRVGFRTDREPVRGLPRPVGQRRPDVRARGGVDAGRPGRARRRRRPRDEPGAGAGHRGLRDRRVPRPLRRARPAGLAGPHVRHLRLPAGRRRLRGRRRDRGSRPLLPAARSSLHRGGVRLGRARAAGRDVRRRSRHRRRRRAGRPAAAGGGGVRAGRGVGRLLAVRWRPGDPGGHGDRAVLRRRRLPARPRRRAAQPGGLRRRVPRAQQPPRPRARRPGGWCAAGQRRRLGLRRRPRPLPAAPLRPRGRTRPRRSGSPAR